MNTLKAWLLFTLLAGSSLASAQGIRLITNEANPYSSLTRSQVRDYFLKKNKQWPNGVGVRFFDRNDDSEERKIFLREILRKTQREVETFWIGQKLYTGHSAPTQVSSDSMMSSMVSRFPGALGYVSGEFKGAKGVKEVQVTGE